MAADDERVLCSICDHYEPAWLVHRDILEVPEGKESLEELETSVICDTCWQQYFQSRTMVAQECRHCGTVSVATCIPLTPELLETWRVNNSEELNG